MIVIPAIDLFDNCAVRLFKGNYEEKKIYSSEPWKLAESFAKNGATLLHLVDLNGARNQLGVNEDSILKIRETTSLKVQLGGGIRDKENWLITIKLESIVLFLEPLLLQIRIF